MSRMDRETNLEYVSVDVRRTQEFVATTDEDSGQAASSSSYEYTEGDVNSPYIVSSLLH
jgi:hypothetical protein